MLKNTGIFILIGLLIGCARPASKITSVQSIAQPIVPAPITTQGVLWQNHGKDSRATNIIRGQLPTSGTELVLASSEPGQALYASPVIVQSADNHQHVYALWASSQNLILAKYVYEDKRLNIDPAFGQDGKVILSADPTGYESHQLGLSSDGLYVFVAHQGGITKYNGASGEVLSTHPSSSPAFRLLIHDSTIFLQTSESLVKLNLDLKPINTKSFDSNYTPTQALPLIVSGEHLYYEHNHRVCKIKDDFSYAKACTPDSTSISRESLRETSNGNYILNIAKDSLADHRKVTAMAAYEDSVIYALTRSNSAHPIFLADMILFHLAAKDTAYYIFDHGISPFDFVNYRDRVGGYHVQEPGDYGRYCANFLRTNLGISFNKTIQLDTIQSSTKTITVESPDQNEDGTTITWDDVTSFGACGVGAGNSDRIALAVHDTTLFLPGVYLGGFAHNKYGSPPTTQTGIQKVKLKQSPVQAFSEDSHHINDHSPVGQTDKGLNIHNELVDNAYNIRLFYTDRFVLHDELTDLTLSVANINDDFFTDRGNEHGTFVNHLQTHLLPDSNARSVPYQDILDAKIDTLSKRNARIFVGNSQSTNHYAFKDTNEQITTLSVGDQVVFFGGSNGSLYMFH